jgi:hypothetical protein
LLQSLTLCYTAIKNSNLFILFDFYRYFFWVSSWIFDNIMSATYSENNKGLNNKAKRLIVIKGVKLNIKKLLKMHAIVCNANWKTGDLQDAEYLFVAGFQFREEFLPLQLKCDLLRWRPRSRLFSSKRPKREDAAQRLQRFVHWEVPILWANFSP